MSSIDDVSTYISDDGSKSSRIDHSLNIPLIDPLIDFFFFYWFWFILRQCQHDNGYIDGRSQIKVHTDERTQVHSA